MNPNPIPTQIYTIPTQNPIPLHMNPNPESNPDSDSDSSFDSDSGFGIAPGLVLVLSSMMGGPPQWQCHTDTVPVHHIQWYTHAAGCCDTWYCSKCNVLYANFKFKPMTHFSMLCRRAVPHSDSTSRGRNGARQRGIVSDERKCPNGTQRRKVNTMAARWKQAAINDRSNLIKTNTV